jgi:hypothetical protein
MKIKIEISDEKLILLGQAIQKMFNLKQNEKGDCVTEIGTLSFIELGRSIMLTMEDTIEHTEVELSELLKKGYK